ncbi:MAG: YqgE/AlgH family protein [Pseudomonadota bacterium]
MPTILDDLSGDTRLTGQLLVAMPSMGDTRFDRAVILVCAHSAAGAMGLIVNKRARALAFSELARQLGLVAADSDALLLPEMPIYFGGPVETGRGFVLHSRDYTRNSSTLSVSGHFAMTATLDALEHIADGEGPLRRILALGYAGWGPGQLEDEIAANAWLTAPADEDLVFSVCDEGKWDAALKTIGVDPRLLSDASGRA